MHSPSFRTPRPSPSPSKSKRARSPASPTTVESRPTKRLSLGGCDRTTISRRMACSPIRARQTSEDWVVQTRSLRIGRDSNSPAADPKSFAPILEDVPREFGQGFNGPVDTDEDMVMEFEETSYDSYAPVTCPPNSPVKISISPTHLHQHEQDQQHSFTSHPQDDFGLSYPQSPPHRQSSDQMHDSQTWPPVPPTPNKKQKFTMGPRNDCEKCRLGVKGHWMHI